MENNGYRVTIVGGWIRLSAETMCLKALTIGDVDKMILVAVACYYHTSLFLFAVTKCILCLGSGR